MQRVVALTIASCAIGIATAQQSASSPDLPYPHGADAIRLLQELREVGGEHIYPNQLAERFDWIMLNRLEDALRASDTIALAEVLNPFLDSLGVSHTRFYDRRHQTYYFLRSLFSTRDLDEPQLYTIGVQLDERELGVIRAVMEGSAAATAGISRGERIVAVDGVPFESVLQWQRAAAISLTVRGDSGDRTLMLTPVLQSFHRALVRATRASERVIDCDDRRIGYLHLWSGTHNAFLEILKDSVTAARLANLDGFVLDLRDGFGGAWWPYLDPFFTDRNEYFTLVDHTSEGKSDVRRAEPQNDANAWAGPLAVIINSGTRSGKESLAYQFEKTGRATLFGSTTAGAFTGGRGMFADRDADYIFFLSVQETLLDGIVIEGVGVSPDMIVGDTTEGDAPLSAALEHLMC